MNTKDYEPRRGPVHVLKRDLEAVVGRNIVGRRDEQERDNQKDRQGWWTSRRTPCWTPASKNLGRMSVQTPHPDWDATPVGRLHDAAPHQRVIYALCSDTHENSSHPLIVVLAALGTPPIASPPNVRHDPHHIARQCPTDPSPRTRNKDSSTPTRRTAAQSSPLPAQTSPSLQEIRDRVRGTAYKPAMHQRSSDCESFVPICRRRTRTAIILTPTDASPCRTDRAVLAVNGFAADGNMFVKKVKQRLEVCFFTFFSPGRVSDIRIPVVPPCTCKGYAFARDRPSDSDDALCPTILPILRLQHPRRH